MLAELASMTLTLARDLQNRALEAETADEATKLAGAFHQVSRGLRQTLALELKVIRFRDEQQAEADQFAADEAAARDMAEELRARRLARRRAKVRDTAGRAIWVEQEAPDWDDRWGARPEPPEDPARLARDLDAWLDRAARRPEFLQAEVQQLVVEACDAIGADPAFIYQIPPRAAARPAPDPAAPPPDTG
jgi:hypothetical protein